MRSYFVAVMLCAAAWSGACFADAPVLEVYVPIAAAPDVVRKDVMGYGYVSSHVGACDIAVAPPSSTSEPPDPATRKPGPKLGVAGWDYDGQCLRVYPLTAMRDGRMQLVRDVRTNERVWQPVARWRYRTARPFLFGAAADPGSHVIVPADLHATDGAVDVSASPAAGVTQAVRFHDLERVVTTAWSDRYVQIGERVAAGAGDDWQLAARGWIPYRDERGRVTVIVVPYEED